MIAVPDCLVHPSMKLNDGKDGHGERRIYTGDSNDVNEYITTKPWKIQIPDDYYENLEDFLTNEDNFSKKNIDRKKMIIETIKLVNNETIQVRTQNGKKDVRRYYIGPDSSSKENIKKYDNLRKIMVAKQTSINLYEDKDSEHFICEIVINNRMEKQKKVKKVSSNASNECLNYKSREYGIEIQTEMNGGEFQLRNPENGYFWPVDGYHKCQLHKCSGDKENPCQYNNHIWEFQGDYFHGNPNKYDDSVLFHNNSYETKHKKDLLKQRFYEENGYKVNIIWESEWVNEKKELKNQGKTWF